MSSANTNNALGEYQKTGAQSGVEDVTPHRLIQMLMEGALEKIATAKGFIERGDIPQKGAHISWAISIINGLRASLDKNVEGDIAQNLDDLYDYMGRRLVEANINNDPAMLDEVASLLSEIKSGWDAIPEDIKKEHAEKNQQSDDGVSVTVGT